jgi:hypothetical protein
VFVPSCLFLFDLIAAAELPAASASYAAARSASPAPYGQPWCLAKWRLLRGVSSGEGMRFSSSQSNVAARARFQSRSRRTDRRGPLTRAPYAQPLTRTRAALRYAQFCYAQFCQRTDRRKFAFRRVGWAAARTIRRRSCGRAGAAVAFTGATNRRGGDPVNHTVGLCVLENYADVLFDQPQLLRLLPDLIQVPARKLAVCAIVRPWAISFVRSLISASDQGSPEFASIGGHS